MLKIFAMIRQDAITRASYRMQMFVSVGSLVAALVPTYFVTQALDPFMRGRIGSRVRAPSISLSCSRDWS
jgi:hypothetical protein